MKLTRHWSRLKAAWPDVLSITAPLSSPMDDIIFNKHVGVSLLRVAFSSRQVQLDRRQSRQGLQVFSRF
jgi:hypothetical protein